MPYCHLPESLSRTNRKEEISPVSTLCPANMNSLCFIFTPNYQLIFTFCLPGWMRPLRSWNMLLECVRRSWEPLTQMLTMRSGDLGSCLRRLAGCEAGRRSPWRICLRPTHTPSPRETQLQHDCSDERWRLLLRYSIGLFEWGNGNSGVYLSRNMKCSNWLL